MIELRDMRLIVALAQHRHFARAAQASGISQPAFSMRIRNLEEDLGVPIVLRGNRFQGFTEEGELILAWARRLLDDARAMDEAVRSARGAIAGTLRIGAVPTTLAYAAKIPVLLSEHYPGILVRLLSATSLEIMRAIEDGDMDAGITYADGVSPDLMDIRPLYEEQFVLVAPKALLPKGKSTATWQDAAELPLTLLEPRMQNRRILDQTFRQIGRVPKVVCETNTFTTSLALVQAGHSATIVPEVLISTFGEVPGTVVLPLTDPKLVKSIALISVARSPSLPTVAALRRVMSADS